MNELLPQDMVDRFTYAISNRVRKEEDVVKFMICVRNSHSYALMETLRLKRWALDFNNEYATNHNKYFTTAETAMNKMRSTLKGVSDSLFKFCYVSRTPLPADATAPTVLERSPLVTGPYSPDMFGLDSFGNSVRMLYDELEAFLKTAFENVNICISVIEEEKYKRQHPEEVMEVFRTCQERTACNSRTLINRMKDSDGSIDNSMLQALEEAEDARQLIVQMFHMLNVSEWVDFVVCKEC